MITCPITRINYRSGFVKPDLSVDTIWRYTRENKIPYIVIGNKNYRYNLTDVMRSLTSTKVQENAANYTEKESNEKLTYQDYLLLPEDPGYRYEILDGILVKEPSPNVMHQRVSRRLQRILEDYFWELDPDGEIFNAPLDVTFHDISVVQPDLFYVSGEQKLIVKENRIDGPPTLIVEVMSPSSSRKDRLQKLKIYQEVQVQHYWLKQSAGKTLECFSCTMAFTPSAAGLMKKQWNTRSLPDYPFLWPLYGRKGDVSFRPHPTKSS